MHQSGAGKIEYLMSDGIHETKTKDDEVPKKRRKTRGCHDED